MASSNDDNRINDIQGTDEDDQEESREEIESDSDSIKEDSDETTHGRKWIGIVIKVSLIVIIFLVVFYLIYFSTRYGKAKFVLSDSEITKVITEATGELRFKTNSRIYFYIEKENKNLESNLVVLQIEFFEKNSYKHYKQISYEVAKDFPKLSAYIPEEYFKRAGKYRIKASLDSKIIDIKDIQLVQ
jgi:hypothetical protein